mmetsp:Transcript_6288/g.11195  ORF Transcript_6288/g.11195 Transcript_6288/m.11195 type:complete len:651 (-) Transcript_6288:870-2822(-)
MDGSESESGWWIEKKWLEMELKVGFVSGIGCRNGGGGELRCDLKCVRFVCGMEWKLTRKFRVNTQTRTQWNGMSCCSESIQRSELKESVVQCLDLRDEIETTPIDGQKTGTSGLRKRTMDVINEPRFVPNWIQSLFNALGHESIHKNPVLVVGGDGRFYNERAIQIILRMAKSNGFHKVIVGRNGILSTPAASALIPSVGALGGIILTASHNPAGIHGDWGIKYNTESGAPATETLTDRIYEHTRTIERYYMDNTMKYVDLDEACEVRIGDKFAVQVVDPVDNYVKMLEEVFDFERLKMFLRECEMKMCFDGMHAVTGEYARRIFVERLGLSTESLMNCTSREDFGGQHPDPNLTYAKELVSRMGELDFGAASDGDGDRNMILGRNFFVSPSDSIAVIADHAQQCVPFFKNGLRGVARSMPTSRALDRVAAAQGIALYETPTGWKFFGNLMDAGLISLCGEESFGSGSTHVGEKDGLWAVLMWLSIIAYRNRHVQSGGSLGVSVQEIVESHWMRYGRDYYARHDYEQVSLESAQEMMQHLRDQIGKHRDYVISEFSYTDPIDQSVVSNQGLCVAVGERSRIVFRLSGTGSSGATIRVYFESYEAAAADSIHAEQRLLRSTSDALRELIALAHQLSNIHAFTGREKPTVIT